MKLYLLTNTTPKRSNYDVVCGVVVRARDAEQARKLAANERGDEGEATWLSPELSSCEELTTNGPSEVVLTDVNAGWL